VPDLERWVPDDPTNVGVYIELGVGPKDGPGEEYFGFLVATPQWLKERVERDGPKLGEALLVVEQFDLVQVHDVLDSLVSRCAAPTWSDVQRRLGSVSQWEYAPASPAEQLRL
jgi:hypothetical protein